MSQSDQEPIEPEAGDRPDVPDEPATDLVPLKDHPQVLAPGELAAAEVALTSAQKELVKQLNPDATAAELQVFFYQCARTGLDPIAKQIYLVKRDNKMVIQTGIDGYRLVAARTGLMAGSDEPVFDSDDSGMPLKATVTVWRIAADGQRYSYTAAARWSEYAPFDLDGPGAFLWKKMPHTMLAKCAEALAIRKAFPAELSGIYTDDEMAQTDFSTLGQRTAAPAAPVTDYKCPSCGSPVADNRAANASPPPGKNTPPAWKCTNSKCQGGGEKKNGGRWGWGSFDPYYFDEVETSGGGPEVIVRGRPSMSGLLMVAPYPLAAARRWVIVASKNDPDMAKSLAAEVARRAPELPMEQEQFTADHALEYEVVATAVLNEMEAPFDDGGSGY